MFSRGVRPGHIVRRSLASIGILLGVSMLVFAAVRLIPGDPISLLLGKADTANAALVAEFRRSYGLDQRLVPPCGSPAQAGFDLGERLLDGREVWGVRREIEQVAPLGLHHLTNAFSLMCPQIIQDHDLAWREARG